MSGPCPDCGTSSDHFVGVEYAYGHKDRYDGVSEWLCPSCGYREGRWSGRRLAAGESEPRWGRSQTTGSGSQAAATEVDTPLAEKMMEGRS